jgi:hypothetical protein
LQPQRACVVPAGGEVGLRKAGIRPRHLRKRFARIGKTEPAGIVRNCCSDLAIAQLTGSKTIAEYLTDAMEEIQKRRIDLDGLQFASALAMR